MPKEVSTSRFSGPRSRLASFFGNRRGNMAVIGALAIAPLTMATGGAIDLMNAQSIRSRLQEAVDAGAMTGARKMSNPASETSAVESEARSFALTNAGQMDVQGLQMDAAADRGNSTIRVSGQARVPTIFLGLIGISHMPIEVTASARVGRGSGSPVCIHALSMTADKAYLQSGGSTTDAPSCTTWTNSSSSKAVILSGNSKINAARNCVVGGVGQGQSFITAPVEVCAPRANPFASVEISTPAQCTFTNFKASGTVSLQPGVYCGGLTLSGGPKVSAAPGIYVIRNGTFTMSGGGSFRGDGVTFVLEGSAQINLSGGGSYWLRAPETGQTAGFVFFQNPDASPGAKAHMSGSGALYYEGIIYFPTQNIIVSGGGSTNTPSPFMAIIANTFTYTGTSTLSVGIDATRTTLPVPSSLYTGTSGGPVLID